MTTLPPPALYLLAPALAWLTLRLYLRRWRPMSLETVVDGDTFVAKDLHGRTFRLRLAKVDCPEMSQRNGPQAKRFVQGLAGGRTVRVRLLGRDRYRRYLADVRVEGGNLGRLLVAQGLAFPLGGGLGLRLVHFGAWLSRKGVHAGFGQPKPWQSFSRSTLGRMLWRLRRRR